MMGSRGIAALLAATLSMLASAAVANAEPPQWYECAKQTGGPYEKGCTKEGGTGGFNLKPGIGKGATFKGSAGGTFFIDMVIAGKGETVTSCSSAKLTGGVAAPNKVTNVLLTISKCKGFNACDSSGTALETIESEKLSGELGWLNKAHSQAGLVLTSEAAPKSGLIAGQMNCPEFGLGRWVGAFIGAISPLGVIGKEKLVTYSVGPYLGEVSPGYTPVVNPPSFEEGAIPEGVLGIELNGPETGNTWQPEGGLASGLEGSFTLKGENLMIQ